MLVAFGICAPPELEELDELLELVDEVLELDDELELLELELLELELLEPEHELTMPPLPD